MSQHYVVMGLQVITACIWIGAALAAFSGYRAFKQRADLAWTFGFVVLALIGLGRAYGVWSWWQELATVSSSAQLVIDTIVWYELRFAAFEVIAAMLLFYAFIKPRRII